MNKCKDCCYRIRVVKFSSRTSAIHEDAYCFKKRQYVKLLWDEVGTDCKLFEEKKVRDVK